jgi:hypothetical protein
MAALRLIAIMLLALTTATAQSIRDSKGTEFWLAFMPNDHSGPTNDPSLIIYVTAESPTSGYVAATRRTGATDTLRFTIANANEVVRINLNYGRYELIGATFNWSGTGDCETVMPCGIHVVAQDEISVYAASREYTTTDAWLALPEDVLGTDHRVMSYASDADVDTTFFTVRARAGYPSQFVVVATRDSTDVTIDLSVARTPVATGSRRTVRLDRGQVYLVQAYVTQRTQNDDLTGSRVRATQPVAVITGHYRAQVPLINDDASRDMLVEQISAVDTWGRSAIIVPPVPPRGSQQFNARDLPLARILAAQDGTELRINGVLRAALSGGGFIDEPLTQPLVVDATKPIACAILDRSTRRTTNASRNGDPSMLIVPPTEQFLSSYTCISIEPRTSGQPVFDEHHLTMIVPMQAAASLRLDGSPVAAPQPIAGTPFGFVHLDVQAGTHRAVCDEPFGIVAYGYGYAESYGYTGGMAFERLGRARPILMVHDTAGKAGQRADIVVTYEGVADSLSFWAYAPRSVDLALTWNATTFIPDSLAALDGRIMQQRITHAFDTLHVGDTVALVPGVVTLGDSAVDSVRIVDVTWLDATSTDLPISVDARHGALRVLDLCTDPRTRLFDPTVETTPLVRIFDVVGGLVATSHDDVDAVLGRCPPGAYLIVRGWTMPTTELRLVE